jgi:hypothetical protein
MAHDHRMNSVGEPYLNEKAKMLQEARNSHREYRIHLGYPRANETNGTEKENMMAQAWNSRQDQRRRMMSTESEAY